MAEQGEYGGPSFGGTGAYGEGLSEEEKEYSNAIARNILGISTNPDTYGAPLDSPEAANYGFGLGSNLSSISPNLAQYASPFLNPSTGQAQFDQGFFDFSGIEGAKKAKELGFGPQLAQLGLAQAIPGYTKNINFPAIMGQHLSPVAYGTKQQQQAVLKSMYDDKEISLQDAIKYGSLVNHVNPNSGTLTVNPDNLNIESYTEGVLHGAPGMSTNVTFEDTPTTDTLNNSPNSWGGFKGFSIPGYGTPPANPHAGFMASYELDQNHPGYAPMISIINGQPIDPRQQAVGKHFGIDNPQTAPQEDIDALMNEVLGLDLSQMDQDVLGLDRSMVSTDPNPWEGLNSSVISDIAHNASISDSPGEAEWAAESALYNQLVQQLAPVEPLNPPDRARPVVRPAARLVGKQAANAPAPVRHDPIANLVRTVLSPKINQVKPAAVKAIKKGKKPDYTMMSDYQQDLVRELLNPRDSSYRAPKPVYARMDDR